MIARAWRLIGAAALLCIMAALADADNGAPVNQAAIATSRTPALLSDYRLFRDAGAREPNAGVTPYDLNTPLWSDGALKFRYVFLPPGAQARYSGDSVFAFPVGAVLIKTFAFAADMRRPTETLRYLETRLLIRAAHGWEARVYVWNDAQTEARLSRSGPDVPISFINADGAPAALEWDVPNENQCLGCHERAAALTPIGVAARNLNRDFTYASGAENQLAHWTNAGMLVEAPADAPRVPNAYDAASGATEARARAYLDVNCAHCHNPDGPAHTSGLDLSWSQNNPALWGVYKRPVAAGRASGGYAFAIEPGHPDRSILLHRMSSTDPGVMMPELGRQIVDDRAVALMREWIAGMDARGRVRE